MTKSGSLLDQLRVRYEALPEPTDDHCDVESIEAIDARMREAFRWLEKAITYLTIPARVSFSVDYRTGIVTVALANVDRLERVTLEFPSSAIDEAVLEDLVRLVLGSDSAFLKRGRLAGLRGRASG